VTCCATFRVTFLNIFVCMWNIFTSRGRHDWWPTRARQEPWCSAARGRLTRVGAQWRACHVVANDAMHTGPGLPNTGLQCHDADAQRAFYRVGFLLSRAMGRAQQCPVLTKTCGYVHSLIGDNRRQITVTHLCPFCYIKKTKFNIDVTKQQGSIINM